MQKSRIKHVVLVILSMYLMLYSMQVFATSGVSTTDTNITTATQTLTNIKKQLSAITKNVYVNQEDEAARASYKQQISVYVTQIQDVRTKISTSSDFFNINAEGYDALQSLYTITSYLNFITTKLNQFLDTTDREMQYEFLGAIFTANSLVNLIGAYTFGPTT